MAEQIRLGIAGAGWPGLQHAKGAAEVGGYRIDAVADLIPQRRRRVMTEFGAARQYADAMQLVGDPNLDAICVCLPKALPAPVSLAALRAGRHVLCETPPAISAAEARKMRTAAAKREKVLLYALQRRFGAHAQASHQAIAKGYAGEVYHVRAAWTRTRGIPRGTGWYARRAESGGGALIDLGIHMLDLGWYLLGQPVLADAVGATHRRFIEPVPSPEAQSSESAQKSVEDQAFALLRFEGGKSIELACSWAINQPIHQNGAVCRAYGDKGSLDVYTPHGAVLYRNFDAAGKPREHPLKGPKVVNYAAMMRHFKECIHGKAKPLCGGEEGVSLMEMIEAIYKS